MSNELRMLWDWWNTLEPGFRFLMSLPFAVPAIAALGDACRRSCASLRRAGRAAQPNAGAAPTVRWSTTRR